MRKTQLEGFASAASQACELLERNLHRASALVADFKQVSADQSSQRRREFGLAELVNETLRTLAPSHKNRPVSINTSIPAEIRLDSYPGPLEQVLNNLINNAILHGMRDDQPLTINISARLADAQAVHLTLSDDGRGMSPEVAAQAFQPFFTTRLGTGGTGLGLHLVHQLVYETLGGSLSLDSQLGAGTRVDIHLPLQAPATQT